MRLRIGDLVHYISHDGYKRKGIVSATRSTRSQFLGCNRIQIVVRRQEIWLVLTKSQITKVIRREDIKEWWKYL